MTCPNGKCEYNPPLKQQAPDRTPEVIKYGTLWAEIELPKLLEERTTNIQEVRQ